MWTFFFQRQMHFIIQTMVFKGNFSFFFIFYFWWNTEMWSSLSSFFRYLKTKISLVFSWFGAGRQKHIGFVEKPEHFCERLKGKKRWILFCSINNVEINPFYQGPDTASIVIPLCLMGFQLWGMFQKSLQLAGPGNAAEWKKLLSEQVLSGMSHNWDAGNTPSW